MKLGKFCLTWSKARSRSITQIAKPRREVNGQLETKHEPPRATCHPSTGRGATQRGAVTAELAVALPAVVALVSVILAIGQWQVQQQRLLVAAATAARAVARGEDQALIDDWAKQLGASLELSYSETLVCADLSQTSQLPGLARVGFLRVSERQCAQKQ